VPGPFFGPFSALKGSISGTTALGRLAPDAVSLVIFLSAAVRGKKDQTALKLPLSGVLQPLSPTSGYR
jgi:hypothetical protein